MRAAILTFFLAAIYDMVFLAWTLAAQRKRPISAAVLSALVAGVSFCTFDSVVKDLHRIPFMLAGYAVGTYITVRWL